MGREGELERLRRAAQGEPGELGALLEEYRPRLERMIALRLDRRVAGRVDARDVLQETFVEVMQRLDEYLAAPAMEFFLWVRFLTGQKLLQLHRKHLGAAGRDARREVPLVRSGVPEASSFAIASAILDSGPTPSHVVMKEEQRRALQQALEGMGEVDREVLVLRHFEQLSNGEIATVAGISESAASQRYFRALARLREVLGEPNPAEEGAPRTAP